MRNDTIINSSDGFTLIELILTMLIASFISAAIFSSYLIQNRIHLAQESVAGMQQNIRAGVGLLTRDIRMAGFGDAGVSVGFIVNETFSNGASPSWTTPVTSDATQIAFTLDLDNDGTIDEKAEDVNGDGRKDMADYEQIAYRLKDQKLQRYSTTDGAIRWHEVAEQIEKLEFRYLDKTGGDTTNMNKVESIEISILAIADRADKKFTNTMAYKSASGRDWTAPGDHYRRRLLVTKVRCRNMGI